METVNLGHSVKDIPVPSRKEYKKMMINSYLRFTRNMRWRVLHFLNPSRKQMKETFGFKSLKNPPVIDELVDFENDFRELVFNIEFEEKPNHFQQKLQSEKEKIMKEPHLIIGADKTSNFYKVKPKDYKELLKKNVEAEYKKENVKNVNKVNKAHNKIVRKLEISDRVFKTVERNCFITLKDHKENFRENPKCRLINPMKPELGKVSKNILTKKLEVIRRKSKLSQWKNVYSVIDWFKNLKNKKNLTFIVFDVVNYYPSITLELLTKALNWAKQFVEISDEDIEHIVETKKSLLVMNKEYWTKKGDRNFDVAQGAFDSAEVCDIVGLFLLSELQNQNLEVEPGVFRDDGLGVTELNPQQAEKTKKKICEIYRRHGLDLTVEANKKSVQFLDVEFDLNEGTYRPFIKPGDVPLYVHQFSNHPQAVLKNIPAAINKRLSALSSNEEMFLSVAPLFQEAIQKAGYTYKLKFDKNANMCTKKKRSRKKNNVLWFNPPYSKSVKTNVGAKFLKLINKHFPKSSPLSKILNRKLVKISYRATPNMKKIISAHNQKILQESESEKGEKMCNCQKPPCPLQGKCLTDNMVYQAKVKTDSEEQTYIGLSSTTFKKRLANHKTSFKYETKRGTTTLSNYVWDLKNRGIDYELEWNLIGRAQPFSPISGICNLCTLEKYHILFTPQMATLNKKDEINNWCPHKDKMLLDKT